jgi:flagellar motor switch protein FliG
MATAPALSQQSTAAFRGEASARMTGLRKAAILMVALGDQMAKDLFHTLSSSDVRQLVAEIAQLGEIPGHELAQVLAEFSDQFAADQCSLRGGADCANRILVQAFGPDRAAQTLQEVNVTPNHSFTDLSLLQRMEPQQLSRFLENEHPQTIALVIAHLDGKKGSTLLMHLDPVLRVETVRRLAQMRQFSPEMAQRVVMMLHKRMQSVGPADRKSYAGFKAVAELLNRLDTTATKAILEEIERQEPKLAVSIRNQMFTFDDLLTVPEASIREIVAAVDKQILARALRNANEALRAHLFKAMSTRAVEMLKDDMESMGPLRAKEISAAQQEILTLAGSLEAEGRVTLRIETEEEIVD